MGLFSSLFGGKKPDNPVLGALADLVDNAVDAAKKAADGQAPAAETTPLSEPAAAVTQTFAEEEPSGFSWGSVMPAEENQFNSGKRYDDYFMSVYRAEFPGYEITCENLREGRAAVITFRKDGAVRLIVELLSQSSGAQKIRRECRKSGTPYLRFYYNHDGWWNTRAYVTQRTGNALGA